MKYIHDKDTPREKLINLGPHALRDDELIALLLHTGTKEKDVMQLSLEILGLILNISYIKNLTYKDLKLIKGISDAKATTILAAVELGRRVRDIENSKRIRITTMDQVYHMLKDEVLTYDQEHLIVICVDPKGGILKVETIYIGTSDAMYVYNKDVFRSAVKINAYGIIVVHNHPSGDSNPSPMDMMLTSKMSQAGEYLNIHLIDHLIIGRGEYYSFKSHKKHVF